MIALGVDFGDARTGLALSDKTGFLASAIGTIHEHNMRKTAEKVADAAKEHKAEVLVLGFPKNYNNTIGPRGEKTIEFKGMLEQLLPGIPVELWDERGTTISAINILNETNTRGIKRKKVLDSVAAVLILQGYLDKNKNMGYN